MSHYARSGSCSRSRPGYKPQRPTPRRSRRPLGPLRRSSARAWSASQGRGAQTYFKIGANGAWWFHRRWGLEAHAAGSLYEQTYRFPTLETLQDLVSGQPPRIRSSTSTETKVDLTIDLAYRVLKGERYALALRAGWGGVLLLNPLSDFVIAGPLGGLSLDWQVGERDRVRLDWDVTPNLAGQTRAGPAREVMVVGQTTPSLFGEPRWTGFYRGLWSWKRWSWGALQLGYDGSVIQFQRAYRYYNGVLIGLSF